MRRTDKEKGIAGLYRLRIYFFGGTYFRPGTKLFLYAGTLGFSAWDRKEFSLYSTYEEIGVVPRKYVPPKRCKSLGRSD